MKEKILLISKDVFMRSYLPVYGNTYNNTPNIDELAQKGTVFNKHYTAAPSTAMAFTSMFTGLYSYETNRETYSEVSEWKGYTLFNELAELGYSCHMVWDESYVSLAQRYSKCYGKLTKLHNTTFLTRKQPPHIKGKFDDMSFDAELEEVCIQETEKLTKEIVDSGDKVFMWIHFPHALLGRNAYGSDIDVVDRMVGMFRRYFDDDSIYITADHGHMNGSHGKYGYGFDVYQDAIQIPLITPRINGLESVNFPTSNTQLPEIIKGIINQREVIYSETAYYMQPHRKMAIIHGKYKYVYEKKTGKEYLFDVEWNPQETVNLMVAEIYDTDRNAEYSLTQRFFYPYWTDISSEVEFLRKKRDEIWKDGTFFQEKKELINHHVKNVYRKMKK